MRILIPVMLLLIGLGGGVGAGLFLGGGPEEDAADGDGGPEHEETAYDEQDEEYGEDGYGEDDTEETGDDYGGYADEGPVTPGSDENLEYVRLNNQFVVPVVQDAAVRSLVVMSLTVEIASGQAEFVFNREPRLRDAFLRVMFSHANAGGFDGAFTSPTALNPLRSGLRDAAYDVLGPIVNDVLIVDIVRQDA